MSNATSDGEAVESARLQHHPLSRLSVLIVEDNPYIIDMYTYVLRKLATVDFGGRIPIDVDFASDGYLALEALEKREFQVVLTDLYMPVMDGFTLVEKIRRESRLDPVRVLAVSGGGSEARERALSLGVDVFLRKPVQFETLQQTLKRLLQVH